MSAPSEFWHAEKNVEQPQGIEENDGGVDTETPPWNDDEHMTALPSTEWLAKWQDEKARWQEERAKWQQAHAHRRAGTSSAMPPPPSTSSSSTNPATPAETTPVSSSSGAPPVESVLPHSSEKEAGHDAGWMRRLWGEIFRETP
ncbi:hypothetical protein MVEN_01030100 [Mycena venus]|uniref:Uncharacterized protein n=1 Tax=Mycena venus TaxID=2733690 RepID=A0A8H6YDY0_9AGAR|nr:hypothetical protein MVEN_01030100 [Mycena venus]